VERYWDWVSKNKSVTLLNSKQNLLAIVKQDLTEHPCMTKFSWVDIKSHPDKITPSSTKSIFRTELLEKIKNWMADVAKNIIINIYDCYNSQTPSISIVCRSPSGAGSITFNLSVMNPLHQDLIDQACIALGCRGGDGIRGNNKRLQSYSIAEVNQADLEASRSTAAEWLCNKLYLKLPYDVDPPQRKVLQRSEYPLLEELIIVSRA
jgi:hypothetical protein